MKKFLIATGVAVVAVAAVAMAQGYSFQNNLTIGSTGPDVTALQTYLISAGYDIPAISSGAASKGYFGSETQTAVEQFQAAHGVPNTGFVGPLTRGVLNGGASTGMTSTTMSTCPAGYTCTATAPVTAATCPAGYTCTANPGTVGTTVVGAPAQITTPGIQGIMSVTQGPVSISTAYAGQTKVPILDARIQAQYSDISIQSMQIDLGSNTAVFNYVYSNIYLIDPSTNTVLATEPLNSSTVVQSGNDYIVGLAGFNFVVPHGQYKDLQVAVDLQSTILPNYLNGCVANCATEQIAGTGVSPWTVAIESNGIRGVDGAGVNDYGPSSAISQGMVVQQNLTLNASASVSLDASSPLVSSVSVTNLTTGQYLGLPIFVFDVNAQGDNLHLHNATVEVNTTGQGSVTAAYLYQGSTLITSAAVSACTSITVCTGYVNSGLGQYYVTFPNISDGTSGASIPINTTVPFTIKVDVSGLTAPNSQQIISASTTALSIYNSTDSTVTISGYNSTNGNNQTVLGQGLNFGLSGTPTITKSVTSQNQSGQATTTYTATFNITAQAVGTSVTFGLTSAVQPSFGTTSTGINLAQIYQNGAPIVGSASLPGGNTTGGGDGTIAVSYSAPSNTTLNSNGTTFTLGQNQSVSIPVTYSWNVLNPSNNVYALQIQGISTSAGTSTFMTNQTQWRTSSI